jgi:hypothetical protein
MPTVRTVAVGLLLTIESVSFAAQVPRPSGSRTGAHGSGLPVEMHVSSARVHHFVGRRPRTIRKFSRPFVQVSPHGRPTRLGP